MLLLTGGHRLVEGSVSIARRFKVSTLLIGLTLVAVGTSSPELFFNIPAAATGLVAPWLAALGMSLSSLLVVVNAMRLTR